MSELATVGLLLGSTTPALLGLAGAANPLDPFRLSS